MTKPLFPKSVRKYIRLQKARIRREVSDTQRRQELIQELCERFKRQPEKTKQELKKTEKPRKVTPKKKEELVATTKEK